jgi:hypothetical protein
MTMGFETPDDRGPSPARAYVYAGDWVSDCTRKGCGNVEFLYTPAKPNGPRVLRKPFFMCSNCGQQCVIDWPDHEMEILSILSRRPVPQNRNWYPKDHPVAINFRIAHGQSIRDLLDENEAHGVK